MCPTDTMTTDKSLASFLKQTHRFLFFTGKGGVGKTSLACATSIALADQGKRVLLVSTDPASNLDEVLGRKLNGTPTPIPGVPNLVALNIGPEAAARAYVEQVMNTTGKGPDSSARALLEEDLRSPCTEEIAVFRAFARTVAQGADAFVVLDTAPTGRTLLLLDATESYHCDVARNASSMPREVVQLIPRLRDASFTRVVVTLPEATPVHEAAALQDDLRRAQIEPFAWVINQSFAESGSRDPLLMARGANELPYSTKSAANSPNEPPSCRGWPKNRSGRTNCASSFKSQHPNRTYRI
jgi:arsenite/tail-anchored protein-transporting ATPase